MKTFLLFVLCFFATLALPQQAPKAPDCTSKEHRQFDFWVGSWVVVDKDDNIQGNNNVELILNFCALQENWKGASGSAGKSFNFYDRQTKKWHQTWIDSRGGVLYLDGGIKGNVMVLQGTRLGRAGEEVLHRISYTPLEDGRVKQHWQSSRDQGKTWQEVFLGFYKKRGSLTSM